MSSHPAPTPAEVFPPGEFLRDELEERGWTETEFAEILGRPAQAVSEILNGKKEITAETAVSLGDALGTSGELWLNLQATYRLHQVRATSPETTPVMRRARLRALVPVRELQKLDWLPDTDNLDDLESSVCELLEIASPNDEPRFAVAARRSNDGSAFSPEQVAWIARVRRLAEKHDVEQFDVGRLRQLAEQMARRIRDPYDLAELRGWLGHCGVVLVVEQPTRGSKIDGVVMFDAYGRPVIGLTTRGDRMDSFVFTLLHEIAHLVSGHVAIDEVKLDENLLDEHDVDIEVEANDLAGQWIFPEGLTVGPPKPRMPKILAIAREHGVHPCFVIGRLQKDGVLNWGDLRRNIPKVRPYVEFG